ncbi:hypothetical protein L1049_013495 [Liquidambar formosana]|uniref:Ubiquitin-like domain-containing protein n=1 Tax=Liquidambar formosana TaxID=63359 RepID=A0AAP0RLJ2_LIQFO
MLRNAKSDFIPRVSLGRRSSGASPLSPLLLIDGHFRKSCSYNKLPPHPLKLSVLKLDGSSFEIEVTKSATVAELKQAVEGVFSHLPKKGPGKISWPHVWGHFCLSYDGQKLVTEDEYIKDYGVKDGDQLQFIRHGTINYNLIKRQSKKRISWKQRWMSTSRLDSCEEMEENGTQDHENDKDLIRQKGCRLAHFLKGWFSYSRLATRVKTRFEGKERPIRSSSGFFSRVRKIMHLYSNKSYSRREKWRKD